MWPFTRKRTLTVFRWTAKAVGYPLEALMKALGFFLYPLKTLKKAIGKFLPNHWKRWKKPLRFFRLPVESAEKSRWENSSYLQCRELTYLRFRLGVCNQSSVTLIKIWSSVLRRNRLFERNLAVFETYNPATLLSLIHIWRCRRS